MSKCDVCGCVISKDKDEHWPHDKDCRTRENCQCENTTCEDCCWECKAQPRLPSCDQCTWAYIQGLFCHETGCPNQHKDWNSEDGIWEDEQIDEDGQSS